MSARNEAHEKRIKRTNEELFDKKMKTDVKVQV